MSVVAAPLRIQMRGASGAGGGEWGGEGAEKRKGGREILRHEIERAEFQPTPIHGDEKDFDNVVDALKRAADEDE